MANEYSDEDIQKYIGGAAAAYTPPPPAAAIPETRKEGFFNALKSGAIGAEADIAAIGTTGMDSAARRKSIELGKEAEAAYQGPSWEDVKANPLSDRPWEFVKGQTGQTLGYMPAYIAAGWAGAKLGAVAGAPFEGVGALPGAAIGSVAGMSPIFYGSGIRRQTQEQEAAIARGETPKEYSFGKAAIASPVESALERFAIGKAFKGTKLGTVLGHEGEKLTGSALENVAKESALKAVGKGVVRTNIAEIPTEVGQQVAERWQAGLDTTSPDAMKEYEDTVAGVVAGISPIGGIGGLSRRRGAQTQIKDLTKPEAGQEQPQKELAPGEQGALFGETPPPAPRSMIDEDMYTKLRGLGADHDTALFATRRDEYGIKMREAFEAGQTPELKYRKDYETQLVKSGADTETATLAALPTEEVRQTYNYLRGIGVKRADAIKQSLVVEPIMADSQESLFAPEGKGKFSYTGEIESAIKPKKAGAAVSLGEAQPFDYGINLFTPGYGGQAMAKELPATTQEEAAPKPGSREDLARTLDDHLAGGRITQQDHELLIGDVNNPEASPKLIKKAMARAITATAKEAKNAVQIGKPKKILPREQVQAGEAGRVGEGVGQVEQGTQVAAEGKAKEKIAPSPVYNEQGEITSGGRTQEELKAQFDGAAARLMGKLTKNARANIVPEEDVDVLHELTAMLDAAIGLGHISFKQAVKYVLDALGLGEGDISPELLKQAYATALKQRGVKAARGTKGAGEALGKTLDDVPETMKPVVMDFMGWDENGDIDPEVEPMTFRALAAKYGEVSHESWKKRLAAIGFTEADRQAQIDVQTTEQATEEAAPDQRVEEGTEEVQGAFTPTGELIKDDEVVERDPTDVGVKKQAVSTDTGLRWKTDIKKAITKWKEPHLAQASAEFMAQGEKSGVSTSLFAEINKEMGRRAIENELAVLEDIKKPSDDERARIATLRKTTHLKIAETSRAEKAAAAQALKDKESAETKEKHAQETVKQLPKQQVQTASRMWTLMTKKPFDTLTAVQQIAYTRGVEAVTSDSQVATEQDFDRFLTNMHNAFLRTNKMEVLHADQNAEAAGTQTAAKDEGVVKSAEDQEAVRGSARQVRPVNVEVRKKRRVVQKPEGEILAKEAETRHTKTYGSEYLYEKAAKYLKKRGYSAARVEKLESGKVEVRWVPPKEGVRASESYDDEDAASVQLALKDAKTVGEAIDILLASTPSDTFEYKVLAALSRHEGVRSSALELAGEVDINTDVVSNTLGRFFTESNRIELYDGAGSKTFVHEAVHAALFREYKTSTQFRNTVERIYHLAYQRMSLAERGMYGAKNAQEFLSEAYSNPEFQDVLSGMKQGDATVLARFISAVKQLFAKLLGKYARGTESVLQELVYETFGQLGTESETAAFLRTERGKDIARREEISLERVVGSKAAELIAGATGSKAVTDAGHYLKIAMTSLEMLHDTVTRVAKTLPSVTDWYKGIMDMKATRTEIKRRADVIAGMASSLSRESYAKTNKFIERATTEQKWYRQPEWLTRKVVVDAGMAAEWKKLTSEEQAIADAVFKFGEDESNNMQKQFKALGVSDVFTQIGKLEGPYAPLMRFGGFVGVLKSQTLLDAEKDAKTGSAASIARVEALKRDSSHFVSKKFYTLGQATAFTTANKSKYAYAVPFTESERLDDKSSMGYQQLQKIMAAVDANTSAMPAGAKEALHKLVKDIYMTTVDQTSARQSGQKRQGIAGADENMLSAFAIHARAHAAFVASIEHGPEVNKAFYKMQQEAKENKYAGQDDFNLLARHYAEMTHYNPSPVSDAVMAGTTVWMLSTSLSYHIQNFTQAVVKTIPKLAADFGAGKYAEAWKHLIDGYKMMGSITEYGKNPDLSKVKDAGLRAALTYAADHGMLDVGIEEDLSHLGRTQTGYAMVDGSSAVVGRVLHLLRQVARTVESWNRISSGTAAYNMAIANGRTHDQAQAYVMDVLNSTQGDTSRTDAPLLLKKIPKVMAQYKRFQFMSAAMYTKAAYAAFKGTTAEERGVGRRMLGFMLLHTSVAGGVLALPLMNLASLAFGMMGGDDDPEDMDTMIRRHLGDGVAANFLLDGAPKALLGIDMSAKLSDRNLFSIAPYTTFDFSSKAGVIGTVAGVAGGPSLSQAGRMADGIGLMKRGELYKGVEKMLPKGLESAMQGFRMANDGVTLKNGDVIIKPEDLSAYALALTALGMPSAQMREITRNQNVQYTVRKFYDDRTKDLTQKFVAAAREKDIAEMTALREEWHTMQSSKDKVRYLFNDVPQELKKQPVHNLTRAVLTARKRQRLEQKVAAQ